MWLTIAVQLYWASFILIGFGLAHSGLRLFKNKPARNFLQFIDSAPGSLRAVIYFAIGISALGFPAIPGYFFRLPIQLYMALYCLLIVSSTITCVAYLKTHKLVVNYKRPSASILLILSGLLVLGYDYYYALRVGGPVDGDAIVQISQITQMIGHKLTFASPFFGQNGVVDVRYSANQLNVIQAMCATLFRTDALAIWLKSYAFYRLIFWLSLANLVIYFLPKKHRSWRYCFYATLPLVYGGYFVYAELPDRVVLVWAALLLIALKHWLETSQGTFLIFVCYLIATTHTLFSLITLGFLGLLGLGLLLIRRLPKQRILSLLVCALLLGLPIVHTLSYPNLVHKDPVAFGALAISHHNPSPHRYGPLLLDQIEWHINLVTLITFSVLALVVWIFKKYKKNHSTLLVTLLLFCAICGYDWLYGSVLGIAYLIYKSKSKQIRLLLVLLSVYYGLLVYNPIYMGSLFSHIPPWITARFTEFNLLALVTPLIGMALIVTVMLKQFYKQKYVPYYLAFLPLVLVIIGPYFFGRVALLPPTEMRRRTNLENARIVRTIQSFDSDIRGQIVFNDDLGISANIAMAVPSNVLMVPRYNTSPMVNNMQRFDCLYTLQKGLRLNDLNSARITRVLTWDQGQSRNLQQLANTKPYLKLLDSRDGFRLYEVASHPSGDAPSPCSIQYHQ